MSRIASHCQPFNNDVGKKEYNLQTLQSRLNVARSIAAQPQMVSRDVIAFKCYIRYADCGADKKAAETKPQEQRTSSHKRPGHITRSA